MECYLWVVHQIVLQPPGLVKTASFEKGHWIQVVQIASLEEGHCIPEVEIAGTVEDGRVDVGDGNAKS